MKYTFPSQEDIPRPCVRFFVVQRRHMAYFKFILEAYEGLATLSTADKLNCIVRMSWDCLNTPAVEQLLSSLRQEIDIVETMAPLPEYTGDEQAAGQQP